LDAVMHAASRTVRSLASAAAAALGLLAGACGGPPPLALLPTPVPVGYDGFTVYDALLVDLDHDGDMDIIASTELGLRYLRADGGRWTDETLGTALEKVAPVTRLQLDGADLLCQRGEQVVRLKWSGIGSWHEVVPDAATATGGAIGAGAASAAPAPNATSEPALAEAPLQADADFDGNGIADHASLSGRGVRIERRDAAGALHDVTSTVSADAASLRADGVRLYAADLDGDGDIDLLAVGGRIMAWFNNGGRLKAPSP
jgi:FG-GAP-like repeat